MPNLLVSFAEQNIRIGPTRWLLSGQLRMRFEWLALLALRRQREPEDRTWVSLEEIGRMRPGKAILPQGWEK